jgi:SSS family solute:Na+ symporter
LVTLDFVTKTLSPIDLAVLLAYLVGVTGFGCWFYWRNRDSEQYMSAGRSLPGWAVGLSIFGSYVSSISFLGNPGKAYGDNWNAFVFALPLPIAVWVAVRWFLPFYRRTGEVSAYSHLERRFGPWARNYAVICYILTQVARLGTILYLLGLALVPLTGWDIRVIISIVGLIIVVYPMLGGTEAVIWTGVAQALVLIGGAVVCVTTLLLTMPEGPAQVFQIAIEYHKFSLGSLAPSLSSPTIWVMLLFGFVGNLQSFAIEQGYVQRYITARSDRDAARSVWLGAMLYIPISAAFFFIGTALYAFYQAKPDLLPASLNALAHPDAVFPYYISRQLPVGLAGLVIAGLCAAAMDSNLSSLATLFLRDVYQRHWRPAASEKESMRVLHLSSLTFGAISIGAALAMIHIKSALDLWWELAAIFGGGLLGLFLLGFISKKADNRAALTGVGAGLGVIIWMTLSPYWSWLPAAWRSPFHAFLVTVFGTATILIVGLLVAARRGSTNSAA